jgi:hypothetical protein
MHKDFSKTPNSAKSHFARIVTGKLNNSILHYTHWIIAGKDTESITV